MDDVSNVIKVLVVDDHPVVRKGLRLLIRPRYGMKVIGEAKDGEEAVLLTRQLKPDVVLMDLVMPRKSGLQAIREILQDDVSVRILVLTSFAEDQNTSDALKAGASGFLLKDAAADDLITAIREVHQGKVVLSKETTQLLVNDLQRSGSEFPLIGALTDRERDVLKGLVEGLSNKEIAANLDLTPVTIRFHVSNILRKLRVANRTQAALYARKAGFVLHEKDNGTFF